MENPQDVALIVCSLLQVAGLFLITIRLGFCNGRPYVLIACIMICGLAAPAKLLFVNDQGWRLFLNVMAAAAGGGIFTLGLIDLFGGFNRK